MKTKTKWTQECYDISMKYMDELVYNMGDEVCRALTHSIENGFGEEILEKIAYEWYKRTDSLI